SSVPGATSYQISQASSLAGPYTPVGSAGAGSHFAVVSGLQPSSAYYFQVSAVDSAGNQRPASGSAMAITSAGTPGPPPIVTATPATPTPTATPAPTPLPAPSISVVAATSGSISLNWSAVQG